MSKKRKHNPIPWDFLDEYRGTYFEGQWPSLYQMFCINVKRYPDRKCWEEFAPEHVSLTYKEALQKVKNIGAYLSSLGIKKGDSIGLTGKNSVAWAVSYMGIISIGAVVVPVDYSLTDEEIEHLLDFVNTKGLFVDGERFERLGKNEKYLFKISLEKKGYEDSYALSLPECNEDLPYIPQAKDVCAYLFTSGTTGTPKAVVLSHENLVSDCYTAQGNMNIYETDVFYAILPIQHAYTMLAVFIESMSVGANVVFGKKLIVSQIFKEMKMGNVTMFLGVPMLFNKLISGVMKNIEAQGKFKSSLVKCLMAFSGYLKKNFGINIGKKLFGKSILSKLSLDKNRICISGGGPLPPITFKRFQQLGIDFVQGYGLTETSPILTLNPIFDFEVSSIGKVSPLVDMKFIDKDENGNGEIVVKGPMVMQGYYNNPKATSEVIDKDGYLHTGDIGYMDSRGFVYLTGRAKNIIVTEGGKNVFPEEIEDAFQLYYDIDQICVLGYIVDHEKKSEACCAIIYPSDEYRKTDASKDEMDRHFNEIVETVNQQLLPYKRIRKVIVIDEPMEMSGTKKIKRFKVAEKYKNLLL